MKPNAVLTNLAFVLLPFMMVIMSIITLSAAFPVPARDNLNHLGTQATSAQTTSTQNIGVSFCTSGDLPNIRNGFAQLSKRDLAPANAGAGVPVITPLYNTPETTDLSSAEQARSVGWKKELLQKLAVAWRSSLKAVQSGGSRAWDAVKNLWNWFLNTFIPGREAQVHRMKEFEVRKQYLEHHIRKASDGRFDMEQEVYHPPTLKSYHHTVSDNPDEETITEFRLLTEKIKKKPQTIPIQIISMEPFPVQKDVPQTPKNEPVNVRPAAAPKAGSHPPVYPTSAPNERHKYVKIPGEVKSEGQTITLPENPTRNTWRELQLLTDRLVNEATRIESDALNPPKPTAGVLAAPASNTGASTSGYWTPNEGSTSRTSSSVYYTAPEWPSTPVDGAASLSGTGGTSSRAYYTPRESPGTPVDGPASVRGTSGASSRFYYTPRESPATPANGPVSVGGTGGTSSPLYYTPREIPGTPANGPAESNKYQ